MDASKRKALGAYYTTPSVAELLVAWAVRAAGDRVCDPACGDGVFLEAANERIQSLGGRSGKRVIGVEVDKRSANAALSKVSRFRSKAEVRRADFFLTEPDDLGGAFDAIVGNPPFIRYQRFNGSRRAAALACATRRGVELSNIANAWAPFVVHAIGFLRASGRLALVLPTELLDAEYARPVLEHLQGNFAQIDVVVPNGQRLFPELQQRVLLLMADGFGASCKSVAVHDVKQIIDPRTNGKRRVVSDLDPSQLGRAPTAMLMLSEGVRGLLSEVESEECVMPLGDVADVDIGYVTGASDFFHFSHSSATETGLPETWRTDVLRRARDVWGARFLTSDWQRIRDTDGDCYLLRPSQTPHRMPSTVRRYLRTGAARVAKKAWHCRRRGVWWEVPIGNAPHAFLVYSSVGGSKMVLNSARVHASNSLHSVRAKRGQVEVVRALAASWLSSLTQISAEVHSHVMGGGLRKINPSAAEKVLVIAPPAPVLKELGDAVPKIDHWLRNQEREKATALIDDLLLRRHLGVSAASVKAIQQDLRRLRKLR